MANTATIADLVKELQPHQVRVVQEHEDLSTKLEALKQFLSKDKPPFVDDEKLGFA